MSNSIDQFDGSLTHTFLKVSWLANKKRFASSLTAIFSGAGNNNVLGSPENDTIYGGKGNDKIDGENGNDILNGNNDNDTLFGGKGDDILEGGAGADFLIGGLGADLLILPGIDNLPDRISGFETGIDKIKVLVPRDFTAEVSASNGNWLVTLVSFDRSLIRPKIIAISDSYYPRRYSYLRIFSLD